MASITINESSANYSYSVGTATYATVALPITAIWGPAFEDPDTVGLTLDQEIENAAFTHFAATQSGLESFISTYRGATANYRSCKDFSYQLALTLLTAGYDLDVCRMCPGTHAEGSFTTEDESGTLTVKAKYPGTFGNNLAVSLKKPKNRNYYNLITYVIDSAGSKSAVENLIFVFNLDDSTDSVPHISEISSSFVTLVPSKIATDDVAFKESQITLAGGTDRAADGTAEEMIADAKKLAQARFDAVEGADSAQYIEALDAVAAQSDIDVATASKIRYMEWIYRYTVEALEILTDKLAYNCNRIALPGWDDLGIKELTDEPVERMESLSPLHIKMMDVAYNSRCATAFIDIPKSLDRSGVFIDSENTSEEGYAQKLSNYLPSGVNDALYSTHSALFAPWGQYTYVGTSKNNQCPPSFLALMIQRAMIKNQSLQYEWAMPTTRKHSLTIGSLDYVVPKKLLDEWQSEDGGVALNVIVDLPDIGVTCWGNSTLYYRPLASYNALQNLSTRLLMNAIENIVYKAGISITFQYNNSDAYSKFYAGVTPILDTMRNVGAIQKYTIEMAADINSLDSVNANGVVGTITIWVYGVIDNITVDLIALPVTDE